MHISVVFMFHNFCICEFYLFNTFYDAYCSGERSEPSVIVNGFCLSFSDMICTYNEKIILCNAIEYFLYILYSS